MTRMISALALVAVAGSASAQFAPGSLLFVTDNRLGGSDTINALDYNGLGLSTLFSFAPGDQDAARHRGLTQGPNGEWYVANSPVPNLDPPTSSIERIDGLFSGTPSQSTLVSSGTPSLQNVTGIEYDAFTDSLIVLNNPGSNPPVPRLFEGVQTYDRATGSYDGLIVPEDFTGPNPRPQALAGGLTPTGRAPGDWYFGTLNGGNQFDNSQPDPTRREASGILGVQFNDAGDPTNAADRPVQDLSPNVTGEPDFISLLRGMDTLPNGNILFSDGTSNAIWELEILGDGSAGSLTKVIDVDAIGRAPGDVIYNPFTNKINYVEFLNNGQGLNEQVIIETDLDGSNRTILASGLFNVGSLVAIPAPGTAALLGLGGLAAVRRRR